MGAAKDHALDERLKEDIDDLCKLCDGELNDWEAKFVDSIARQCEQRGTLSLSPRQRGKIEALIRDKLYD